MTYFRRGSKRNQSFFNKVNAKADKSSKFYKIKPKTGYQAFDEAVWKFYSKAWVLEIQTAIKTFGELKLE